MDDRKLVSIRKAAKAMGVPIETIRQYEKWGWIEGIRTPGGHRRYCLADLEKFTIEKALVLTKADGSVIRCQTNHLSCPLGWLADVVSIKIEGK